DSRIHGEGSGVLWSATDQQRARQRGPTTHPDVDGPLHRPGYGARRRQGCGAAPVWECNAPSRAPLRATHSPYLRHVMAGSVLWFASIEAESDPYIRGHYFAGPRHRREYSNLYCSKARTVRHAASGKSSSIKNADLG